MSPVKSNLAIGTLVLVVACVIMAAVDENAYGFGIGVSLVITSFTFFLRALGAWGES